MKPDDIAIEIGPPVSLSPEEKAVLAPGLERRGLSPDMLDIMTNIPNRTRIIKARAPDGSLLAASSILLTPKIFMKHCFGEGNHIGTNNTFYFSEAADKTHVLTAIFRELIKCRHFGTYVGVIQKDAAHEVQEALRQVPHVVGSRTMECGSISTTGPDIENALLRTHGHLSRQVNRFRNKGGSVHCHVGPVPADLADVFASCCEGTYSVHKHPGGRINIQRYAVQVREFLTSHPSCVHFYAKLGEQVVGVETSILHRDHLELTEGGFRRSEQTYHAYENIILASVRYAAEHGLKRVSYGLITNQAKDRLMDRDTRVPVFLIMLFRSRALATVARLCRRGMHKRFPMPFWRDGVEFPGLSPD